MYKIHTKIILFQYVSLYECKAYGELENINVYKKRQKQREIEKKCAPRCKPLTAQQKAELKQQAAIQRQVLAPLPPIASRRRDDMPAECYRYHGCGRVESSSDSDDYNYKARSITRKGADGAGRYNDRSKDDDRYLGKAIKNEAPLADERMYSSTYTATDNDDDRYLDEAPADYVRHSKTKPEIYTGAKGITKGGPSDVTTHETRRPRSVERITGNRTVDLFLHDTYYKSFIAKTKAVENKFLNDYLVKMVQADSVHCWACEQVKSAVFTSDDLMHQIRDIFDDEDEAKTRDDNVRYSWKDFRNYSEKMADIFATVSDDESEKLPWFYFRIWFVNHRMSHVLVYRARLVITCHQFDPKPQEYTTTPRYDVLYSADETYTALNVLEYMQNKAVASRQRGSTANEFDKSSICGDKCKLYGDGGKKITRLRCAYPAILSKYDDMMETADNEAKVNEIGKDDDNDDEHGYDAKGAPRGGPSTADNDNDSDDDNDEYGYDSKAVTRRGPSTAGDDNVINEDDDDEHGYDAKGVTRGGSSTAGNDDDSNDDDSNDDVEDEEETISHINMDLCSVATSFVNVDTK